MCPSTPGGHTGYLFTRVRREDGKGLEILTPTFSVMGLSHLASILRKTGSLKAEENEALGWSSPDPCPKLAVSSLSSVVGLADGPCGNPLPGDTLPD